jgi:hypothetical protein
MARNTAPLVSAWLVVVLSACATNTDVNGVTGLPSDMKLSDLDGSEYAMACSTLREGARRALPKQERDRVACTWLAGSQIATEQAEAQECEGMVQRCLDGLPISRAPKPQSTADLLAEMGCETTDFVDLGFSQCGATVAEYEACVHASTDRHRVFLASITCDAVSDEPTRNMIQQSTTAVPECNHLIELCPSLDQ